jgi:hypothetical protein
MTSRNALLALVLLCWPPVAFAQPATMATPTVHAATGMTFPATIGEDARLIRSANSARADNLPDRVFTWNYDVRKSLDGVITVHISNLGQTEIPTGPDSPLVEAEFEGGVFLMTQMFQRSRPLQAVKGPTDCTVAQLVFRCIAFLEALPNGIPSYTMLLVTGYRNNVVLISADWNGKAASLSDAEAYFDRFVSALIR